MTVMPSDRKAQLNSSSIQDRRLRILFLAPFAPQMQANHGGGRVIAQLMKHLAQKHSVGICYLRVVTEPEIDNTLKGLCEVVEEVVIPEHKDSSLNQWARRLGVWKDLLLGKPLWAIDRYTPGYAQRVTTVLKDWRPDIIQLEFHIMGQYLSALTEYPAPRILVQHEPGIESVREAARSAFAPGRIMPQFDLLAWKRFERKVMQQVQAVVVFTKRDHDSVRKLELDIPIAQIPLGAEIPEPATRPSATGPLSLLFIGSFKHLPNVDAADRLIKNIFPTVQKHFPDVRLYIVGAGLPSDLMKRASENVILTGYVPDVTPYMNQATIVVVPLRLGGGMRVKVLDALAAGKALVASSRAVEGLDLKHGEQVMLAEEDDEFSCAIVQLLNDPQKRDLLATQARAWASANLSWEKTAQAYENLYHQLLQNDGEPSFWMDRSLKK